MRIAIGIEYTGTKFYGWQSQENVLTVQSTLETALSRVADEPIYTICAGRTDAGVHASHQVVHFETSSDRKVVAWTQGTNVHLPGTISVQWAKIIDDSFHARFSALSRRYQYYIYNQPLRSGLFSPFATWVQFPLNESQMHFAAQHLIGEHDFSSFRSSQCQSRTPQRHVFALKVFRKNSFIVIDIIANSFLHHMVRNIVGALIEIGSGRKGIDWCHELLQVKDRKLAAKTALPQGLYLTGVRYPDIFGMPFDFRCPYFFGEY